MCKRNSPDKKWSQHGICNRNSASRIFFFFFFFFLRRKKIKGIKKGEKEKKKKDRTGSVREIPCVKVKTARGLTETLQVEYI